MLMFMRRRVSFDALCQDMRRSLIVVVAVRVRRAIAVLVHMRVCNGNASARGWLIKRIVFGIAVVVRMLIEPGCI